MVRARQSKNRLLSVYNAEGDKFTDHKAVSQEAVSFFQHLFGGDPTLERELVAEIRGIFYFTFYQEDGCLLSLPVEAEEMKRTMFSLNSNKAPGPDGYSAHFFKSAWEIVSQDVIEAVKSFFASGKLLREVNSTIMVLVPKVPNPTVMGDFRPISCCNTIYKCITKLIANRIKGLLPKIISPTQSAFVEGRKIKDNVLLAQELLINYHRKTGKPRCAIKMDLKKAYDSVHWDFILGILKAVDLLAHLIECIAACITTPKFSVSINGGLEGYFSGGKGLRQGDPLSPYLFVLAMEVFSRILVKASSNGRFSHHPRCAKLDFTHLCFADDLLLFCQGDLQSKSASVIKESFDSFSALSGLSERLTKTNFSVLGWMKILSTMLRTFLASKKGPCPSSFLECPLFLLDSQPETVGLSLIRLPTGLNLGLANGFPMRVDFSSSDQCCSVFRSTGVAFSFCRRRCARLLTRSSDLSSGMVQLGSLRLPRWLGTWSASRERKEGFPS